MSDAQKEIVPGVDAEQHEQGMDAEQEVESVSDTDSDPEMTERVSKIFDDLNQKVIEAESIEDCFEIFKQSMKDLVGTGTTLDEVVTLTLCIIRLSKKLFDANLKSLDSRMKSLEDQSKDLRDDVLPMKDVTEMLEELREEHKKEMMDKYVTKEQLQELKEEIKDKYVTKEAVQDEMLQEKIKEMEEKMTQKILEVN